MACQLATRMSLTDRAGACGIRSRASRVPLWPYVPGSLAQRLLNATIDVQEHRVAGYSANRIQYVYPDCVFWMPRCGRLSPATICIWQNDRMEKSFWRK